MTGVTAVGETPKKTQNRSPSQHRGSKVIAERVSAQCIVADTMSSSFNPADSADSQRKRPESKLTGSCKNELQMHFSSPHTDSDTICLRYSGLVSVYRYIGVLFSFFSD